MTRLSEVVQGCFEIHCTRLPRLSLSINAATSASSSLFSLAMFRALSVHPPCILRWRSGSLETTRDNALLRVSQLFGNCCASVLLASFIAHLIPKFKAVIFSIEVAMSPNACWRLASDQENLAAAQIRMGVLCLLIYSSTDIFVGFGAAASMTPGVCRSSSRLKRLSFSKSGPTTLIPTTFYRVSAAVRIGVDRYTSMHEHTRLDIPCRSPRE
jgi:hypothetical protein